MRVHPQGDRRVPVAELSTHVGDRRTFLQQQATRKCAASDGGRGGPGSAASSSRLNAFRTFDSSSAVRSPTQRPIRATAVHASTRRARWRRRQRRSSARSCRDMSTRRCWWFLGVVTWARTRFRRTWMNELRQLRSPHCSPSSSPARMPVRRPHRSQGYQSGSRSRAAWSSAATSSRVNGSTAGSASSAVRR